MWKTFIRLAAFRQEEEPSKNDSTKVEIPKDPSEANSAAVSEDGQVHLYRTLGILYSTMFLLMMGFSMILPIIPFYMRELGSSAFIIGVAESIYAFTQFVSSPVLGGMSDRFGRKRVMAAGMSLFALSFGLLASSTSVVEIILYRAIGGVGAGIAGVNQAFVIDVSPTEKRTMYLGFTGAFVGLGIALGPAIGALFTWEICNYIAMGMTILNCILIIVVLKEPKVHIKRNEGGLTFWGASKHLVRNKQVVALVLAMFLFFTGVLFPLIISPLYGADYFGLDQTDMGLAFTFIGIVLIISQIGVSYFSKKYGPKPFTLAGILLTSESS